MSAVDGPLAPITNGSSRMNGSALNGKGDTNGDLHDGISEPAPAKPISFDPEVFRLFLASLLPPLFGASPEELESIFDEDFHERASRFAPEGGGVIYVVKKKDEQECEHPFASFFCVVLKMCSRGRAALILLQDHTHAYLRPLSCHDSCHHQARPCPRLDIPDVHTTTYSQSLRQR